MYWKFLSHKEGVQSFLFCFSDYPDISMDTWCWTRSLLVVGAYLVAQSAKSPPGVQETWVW